MGIDKRFILQEYYTNLDHWKLDFELIPCFTIKESETQKLSDLPKVPQFVIGRTGKESWY